MPRPAPNRTWPNTGALVAVVAILLAIGGVGVALAAAHESPQATVVEPTPGSFGATTDPADIITDPVEPPTEPAEPTTDPAEAGTDPAETAADIELQDKARTSLQDLRDQDIASLRLNGQWVAQLASKHSGTVDPFAVAADGSHRFKLSDILAEHQELRSRGDLGTVFLLKSTDYNSRKHYGGYVLWVTFADFGATSEDEVKQWCTEHFPDLSGDELKNDCAPRTVETHQ
jgi:hypothetical protein